MYSISTTSYIHFVKFISNTENYIINVKNICNSTYDETDMKIFKKIHTL